MGVDVFQFTGPEERARFSKQLKTADRTETSDLSAPEEREIGSEKRGASPNLQRPREVLLIDTGLIRGKFMALIRLHQRS